MIVEQVVVCYMVAQLYGTSYSASRCGTLTTVHYCQGRTEAPVAVGTGRGVHVVRKFS